MSSLNVKEFGLAVGLTAVLLYLGCAMLMAVLGHGSTVKFFSSLLHGLEYPQL